MRHLLFWRNLKFTSEWQVYGKSHFQRAILCYMSQGNIFSILGKMIDVANVTLLKLWHTTNENRQKYLVRPATI